ncbi:hypothetical protein OOZ51_11815 [Arthrobacter sp. MI7-26]|uniref:hypothetical protein n=1 Tax=Arthrobacter sp. MI7-26 TaxID=2993653 RepID=UPI00224994A5|nr:hypothetical protein [Arthrobacter sp. MI7-26]MCX2748497.1 hypothetical protein [Arthrobacter sp. MI7-26]
MNDENRKPIIAVVLCGVIAVLVLVFGVSCGGGNNNAAATWQAGFSQAAKGGILASSDLMSPGGQCSAAATQLLVAGSCIFEVRKFGGPFDLGSPTKRARLAPQQAVTVTLVVEGTRTEQDVTAGDTVSLTFGTSGGQLGITCRVVGTCALKLLEAG